MDIDTELAFAEFAARQLPAPQGPRYVAALGRIRSNLPRIQKNTPALLAFASELLPVIRKHWPAVGPAVNDLLPILEAVANDLQGVQT